MERGSISTDRDAVTKKEIPAELELIRLAVPRRVFSLSHMEFLIDRVAWLFKNRDLIGGLTFTEEPEVLRFFFGRLKPVTNWPDKLVKKFKKDFGQDSL
jgi:tryptophanase